MELRDNLLVTMGARAAYMHDRGDIELPSGVEGEKTIAEFVARAVSTYITYGNIGLSVNFDEFAEGILKKQYGVEKDAKAVTDDDDEFKSGYKSVTICNNALNEMVKQQSYGESRNINYTILKYLECIEKQIMLLDERTRKC